MASRQDRRAAVHADHLHITSVRLKATADDIQALALSRQIWRTSAETASASSHVQAYPYFFNWVTSQYAQSACVAIRRLTEAGPKAPETNSLAAVLRRIANQPQAYPWRYIPEEYRLAGSDTVDPARVSQDIDLLISSAATVRTYVNKHLAHLEKNPKLATTPTLTDLDTTIDLLAEMLHRYTLLVTGADLMVMPVVTFNWTAVFDRPWRE